VSEILTLFDGGVAAYRRANSFGLQEEGSEDADDIPTNHITLLVDHQGPVAITIGRDQGICLVFVYPGGQPFRFCHGFGIDRHKAIRPAQIDDFSAQCLQDAR